MKKSGQSRRALLVGMAAAVLCARASEAGAQMTVIDPSNLAQNIMQASRALEQINNQIRQIEQQARMLSPTGLQLAPELAASIRAGRRLFEEAEALSFKADEIAADLRDLYPETYEGLGLEEVLRRSDRWLEESRASLELAMAAEARAAESVDGSRAAIERALLASSEAEGQTGAAQAGNQLLGVMAAELAELRALIAAQGRALETERMERLAREARASEIRRRAFPARRPDAAPARSAF